MPLEWKIKHIKADGNCFYRALYNAATETGNIGKFAKCFGIALAAPAVTAEAAECAFVAQMRAAMAARILGGGADDITTSMYHRLAAVYREDRDTYRAILQAFPAWTAKSLRKFPKTIEKFRQKFARHVQRDCTWASELEVRIVSEILAKYRRGTIQLCILNRVPRATDQLDCKIMYLLNDSEVHYNILVCRECPAKKIINPKTRRCVTKDGAIGKRLRKI